MKKIGIFGVGLLVTLLFGVGAHAKDKTIEKTRLTKVSAKVEAIDQATRVVTLKGPKGNAITFKVDEAVKNLPQVQVGDEVVVKYHESLALRLLKPDEAAVNEAAAAAATAKPGATPAGVGAREVTVTVSIEAIDTKRHTVTFKGPAGNLATIKAENPKNLEKVKVGDRVAITYSEALAVSVEKAGK